MGGFAGSSMRFLAGLIGRGGGSLIVPIFYLVGLEAKMATATSAMIVTFSGASSFVSPVATAVQPDWFVWLLCAAAVFFGSQTGSRLMAGKLKSRSIKITFGIVLLAISTLMVFKETYYNSQNVFSVKIFN